MNSSAAYSFPCIDRGWVDVIESLIGFHARMNKICLRLSFTASINTTVNRTAANLRVERGALPHSDSPLLSSKDVDRKLDAHVDSRAALAHDAFLSIKLKIKEPGRSAFSLISFKYHPTVDHPVHVAQELVAENHVYGHDYILVAANIDKVLSHKNKVRFALHKVDGKGSRRLTAFSLCIRVPLGREGAALVRGGFARRSARTRHDEERVEQRAPLGRLRASRESHAANRQHGSDRLVGNSRLSGSDVSLQTTSVTTSTRPADQFIIDDTMSDMDRR